MNNDMTIRIITEEAKEIEASVISLFEILENQSKYAIYTFNEEDAQGLVKIYASRITEVDGLYTFTSISDSEEWGRIKSIMKYMAKDNGDDGSNNGTIKLISAKQIKSQMNEPISVNLSETKAAKIGPNYKTGITNNYLNNVKEEATVVNTVEPPKVEVPNIEIPQPVEAPVSVPPIEVTPIDLPKVEDEGVPEPVSVEPVSVELPTVEEPKIEMPEVEIPNFEPEVPKFEPSPVENDNADNFDLPKMEEEPKVETNNDFKPSFDFEVPKFEEKEEPVYEAPQVKERPSVDSVLNKASYYQNIPEEKEEKRDESNENIIQSIGLEFMKKVSELAEYEKELNKKNRDLESKERLINRLERELAEKEEKQKSAMLSNKDKEMELRKIEKELSDKDNDLNRRIMEFNKKISMFQQTFETISKVD